MCRCSLKPPESVSLCRHRSRVHCSYSVLPKEQFVGTHMNVGCKGSAWCNIFIFFWGIQQRQHQQGPADHTEGDLRWSQPWKGQPQPCPHHFNPFSASLLPTWGLARCSPPPGVSLLPPVPLPPLATSDGFISLAARTASLQLGFHQRI